MTISVINDDLGTRKKFAEFLKQKTLDRMVETGEILGQNDMAAWLGVPTTSFNQWWNGVRLPRGVNIDLLAEKLGLGVYDVLGVPERIPADPLLKQWVKLYYAATPLQRERMIKDLDRSLEESEVSKSDQENTGALAFVSP